MFVLEFLISRSCYTRRQDFKNSFLIINFQDREILDFLKDLFCVE